MIKTFDRVIKNSQSNFKLAIIKKNVTQQCSYNLPLELENYLKSLNFLKKVSINQSNYINYELNDNVRLVLGNNIISLIGKKYSLINNKVVFTHTQSTNGDNPKFQLKKTEFAQMKNLSYDWFVELYGKNFEGITFNTIVDDNLKTVTFDLEFTCLNNEASNDDTNDQLDNSKVGYNKIFYGAPGCGKSHYIQYEILNNAKDNVVRTTFHPEYTNSDFIGQIMPVVETQIINNATVEKITYKYVAGPFAKALLKALMTDDMVYLIIEEINRGNASSIFGDIFQLLDRKISDDENCGESEYPIYNENLQKFINDELKKNGIDTFIDQLVIPSNLTILATMNTSDQNVFTLDTAFKRRWKFEQISNDISGDTHHPYKDWKIPGTNVSWEEFLIKVNDKILDDKMTTFINEDKRLGKYFVSKECLTNGFVNIDQCIEEAYNFGYKVLEYIWSDVSKLNPGEWFDDNSYKSLEELINGFISDGLNIFKSISFEETDD